MRKIIASVSQVLFFPDPSQSLGDCKKANGMLYKTILGESRPLRRMITHLRSANETIDVCLYLITSKDLAKAVTDQVRQD